MAGIVDQFLSGSSNFLSRAQNAPASPVPEGTRPKVSFSFLDQLRLDELFEANSMRHWLFLLLAIMLGLAGARVASFLLNRLSLGAKKRHWNTYGLVLQSLMRPAALAVFTCGFGIGLAQLSMSPPLQIFAGQVILLCYLVALFWLAFNLVTILENALYRVTRRTATTLDDQLVPVIRKSLRIFIVVVGALFILQNVFHRDVGAWLAGLGIAGLAVSLSAQDSLRNLFGSMTILFDHPFSLGHLIKFGGYMGTVEEIGFRSTKIRTADGTVVTIPNSNIVNDPVDNWAVRPTQRRLLNIRLAYDTPMEKVQRAVEIARELLETPELRGPIHDPDSVKNADAPHVNFNEINNDSLNIQVVYWFRSLDYWAFTNHAEKFNIAFLRRLAEEEIHLAPPTQALRLIGPRAGTDGKANGHTNRFAAAEHPAVEGQVEEHP
ncbi:MAG TPA: mechanosensitive ion channel family protein [Phycisphaerae bacterium]|jgi:MscS family membrane protein|nr:mechanosensitive ion channel family protein [Phycisphaerae bacterium]